MIQSFRCKHTEKLYNGEFVKAFDAFERAARKRLQWLHAAVSLEDLRNVRGNRLEALSGDREGQYSTVFASTINGASAFVGPTTTLGM